MQSSGSKDADMVDSPSYLGGRGRGALLRQVPLQGQQSCSVTEQIIEAFFAQGLTLEQASAMHFTVLLRKLHEEQLLKVMVKTVEHVFFLSCSRARYTVDMNLNIKVFIMMAAYMISYALERCFEELNRELEPNLAQLVVPLLDCFQQICNLYCLHETPALAINQVIIIMASWFPSRHTTCSSIFFQAVEAARQEENHHEC